MKAIVITILACVTAIACVMLLRIEPTPRTPSAQERYRLYSMDETSNSNGKTVKTVYRLDAVTGKTWRIESKPVPTGVQDAQHNPLVSWADGWEEVPESTEAAVAKLQAEYQRAASH